MEQLWESLLTKSYMPLPVVLVRLVVAAFLGAMIGIEREAKSRPAGLRTLTLISLASAVFTIITVEIVHSAVLGGDKVQLDPIRIIEAVTAGVAFLAVGAIIQSRGHVYGITTGAAMWLSGAIGVACGLGYFIIAIVATTICLAVTIGLNRFSGDGSVEPERKCK